MSELKAVHAFDVYEAYTKTGDDDAAQVYIKSEADKMIADLKDKANYYECEYKLKSEELADTCRFYEDELRHQKYKLCLAMAYKCVKLCQKYKDRYRWAEDENLEHYYNHKIEFFARWHNRWLELAEKFKEADDA